MATIQQKVSAIVKRLEKTVADYVRAEGLNKPLKPYPPATPQLIARVEKYLSLSLPDSYRAFLELHNGYDYLAYPGHMLPVDSLLPGNVWFDRVVQWKQSTAKYGGTQVLDGLFIAFLDQPNDWTYLDPNRPAKGNELTVVTWLNADTMEYSDLVEFLESRLRMAS